MLKKITLPFIIIFFPFILFSFADNNDDDNTISFESEPVLLAQDSVQQTPEITECSVIADSIIDFSRKYLGTPYGRGGKGPKRFDCSGFAGFVFKHFGYALEASSSMQAAKADRVPKEELKKGDLIFFKGRNSKAARVGHVGIVISNDEVGNITFIHSDFQGGVRIDQLNKSPYYKARYVTGRTIINEQNSSL